MYVGFVGPIAAKHTAAEERLEQLWQRHLDVSAVIRIDRKGDPRGLPRESTASCVKRSHAKRMPPEIEAAFQQLLAGALLELNAYAC